MLEGGSRAPAAALGRKRVHPGADRSAPPRPSLPGSRSTLEPDGRKKKTKTFHFGKIFDLEKHCRQYRAQYTWHSVPSRFITVTDTFITTKNPAWLHYPN